MQHGVLNESFIAEAQVEPEQSEPTVVGGCWVSTIPISPVFQMTRSDLDFFLAAHRQVATLVSSRLQYEPVESEHRLCHTRSRRAMKLRIGLY